MVGLTRRVKLPLIQPTLFCYIPSLVRWAQCSYIHKHRETLELTEKHDKRTFYNLRLTVMNFTHRPEPIKERVELTIPSVGITARVFLLNQVHSAIAVRNSFLYSVIMSPQLLRKSSHKSLFPRIFSVECTYFHCFTRVTNRGVTRGGTRASKLPTILQVLSSIQYICPLEYGNARLVFCKDHHLTSVRPWLRTEFVKYITDYDVLCLRNNALAVLYRRIYEIMFQGNFPNDKTYSWRDLWQFTAKNG